MPDLTPERIAELRACHDKVRSFHGTHDLGGLAAAMHEWSRQLQMSSDVLLDAAERGLTGGWVRNGPDVEKPVGRALLMTTGKYWGANLVATWSGKRAVWLDVATDDCWRDEDVSHFMAIKEPTDGQ